MAQLVASMSGEVLGGVVEVVGSNLARGKLFYSIYYALHIFAFCIIKIIKIKIQFTEYNKNNKITKKKQILHLYEY